MTSYTFSRFQHFILALKAVNLYQGMTDKEMRTPILPKTEPRKSYTFNLTVGKEKLEIESVIVEDWTTKDILIPGGQAEEDFYD